MKDVAAALSLAWSRRAPGIGWQWLGLLVFLLVVFGPLLGLLAQAGASPANWSALALPTGRRAGLLVNSVGLAASVAVAGLALGILAASVLWRWPARLRWLLLALAPIPPYVHALAWSSIASRVNSVLQGLGLPAIAFQGWIATWWVQLISYLPIAVGLALVGLESVEPAMIEAARLVRSDVKAFVQVVLPLAAPALVAGAGLLFLLSLTDYSVPSLNGVNVYSLEIFAEYSASNQPARVLGLALPVLVVAVTVVVLSQAGLRNAAQSPARRRPAWATPPAWTEEFVWLQRAALILLALQFTVPVLSLVATVGTWQNLVSSVASAGREIAFTFFVALSAALGCLPMALLAATGLARSDRRGRLWWLLVTVPLAVPASLIGIGLIAVWNSPGWSSLYGSSLMPVLAALARFTPLAAIVLLVQLRRIDPLLVDAARVSQVSPLRSWLQIRLPMLAPGLLAAAAVVFALSLGELGATLIVAPPGQATLTMRIYNYLHYGASSTVAGLCLMMVAAALAAGCLALLVLGAWSRLLGPDPRLEAGRPA